MSRTAQLLAWCALVALAPRARAGDDWVPYASGVFEARFPDAPAVVLEDGLPHLSWTAVNGNASLEVDARLIDDGMPEKQLLEQAFPQGVAIGMNSFKTWLAFKVDGKAHQAVELEWKPGALSVRERELRVGRVHLAVVVRAETEPLLRALADRFFGAFKLTLPGATPFTFQSGYRRPAAEKAPDAELKKLTAGRRAAPARPSSGSSARPSWAAEPSAWPPAIVGAAAPPPWAGTPPPVPPLDVTAPRPAGPPTPLAGFAARTPSPMMDSSGIQRWPPPGAAPAGPLAAGPLAAAAPVPAPSAAPPSPPGRPAAPPPPPSGQAAPSYGALFATLEVVGDFFGQTAVVSTSSSVPLTGCELRLPVTGTYRSGPAENLKQGQPLRIPLGNFKADPRPGDSALARGQAVLTCREGSTALDIVRR